MSGFESAKPKMPFRPDIEGMRAIAVIAVVLFHAFPTVLGGGFVGVDVFFVLSGYLISEIIFRSLDAGTFQFSEFFARRIVRIFPALSVVLLVCLMLAPRLLFDEEVLSLSKHIAAASAFMSNLILLKEGGYFDTSAAAKPLLHLWSLGVEMQFYLAWPFIVYFGWKQKKAFGLGIALLLVLSFSFNVLQVNFHPVSTFYLPITRFWELLAGALLAYVSMADRVSSVSWLKKYSSAVSLAGFVLLLGCILFLSENNVFPGGWAAIPVLATVLIVAAGVGAYFNRTVLTNPVLQWFGKISYPLYLWHWPLLSVAFIVAGKVPPLSVRLGLVVIAVILSWATWRFLERPLRRHGGLYPSAAMLGIVVCAIGLTANAHYGGDYGLMPAQLARLLHKVDSSDAYAAGAQPSIMLLGDSHADHLFAGLDTYTHGDVANFAKPGCIPFYDVDRYDRHVPAGICPQAMAAALTQFETSPNYHTIVLSSMGPLYLDATTFRDNDPARITGIHVTLESQPAMTDRWQIYETGMRNTLSRLQKTGKKVVFALDVPELGIEPAHCRGDQKDIGLFGVVLMSRGQQAECDVPRAEYDARIQKYKFTVLAILKDYPQVTVFDPTGLFCDTEKCHGEKDGHFLYRDYDHLSTDGSNYVAQALGPVVSLRLN